VSVPDACSLDARERQARLRAFAELISNAEIRTGGEDWFTARFRPNASLAAGLAELAARELECCSFFRFRLELEPGAVVFHATAPPTAAQTLKRIFRTSPSSTT
jgi:hypothetical protein